MLQIRAPENAAARLQSLWPDEPAGTQFDIHRLLSTARRQWRLAAGGAAAATLLCVGYLVVATPLYTATTTLLVDTLTARSLEDGPSTGGVPIIDTLAVDSQVEVIRSQNIIAEVINALDLVSKPPFSSDDMLSDLIAKLPAPLQSAANFVLGDDDEVDPNQRARLMRAAGKRVARELDVKRLGRSYVLQLSYTSPDPRLAAEIANGFTAAYLRDQLSARQAAAREASSWLQEGLREIRQKAIDADLAVQRYRAESKPTDGSTGSTPDEVLAHLRELEREADSLRSLRTSLTQRFEQAAQEQSFPVAEARVIGTAIAPDKPSYPNKLVFLAAALVLGGLAGGSIGLLREHGDRFFRTGAQVRDELDVDYIGPLPVITGEREESARRRNLMRHVLNSPLSRFAETLRAVRVAADIGLQGQSPKVIGVISLSSGEGKSTVAKNLASLIAQQGARTLLIDGDLRQPDLSRMMSPSAAEGLCDVLLHSEAAEKVMLRECGSDLCFLPSVESASPAHAGDLLASGSMRDLLARLGGEFDYIVIDLPPIGSVVDARAAAGMISGFVLVLEWGRSSRGAVRETLNRDPRIRDRCIGAVLNKVPPAALEPHEHYTRAEGVHA